MRRHSLSDHIADEIRRLIRTGGYEKGDRLPAIMDLARRYGVGHPTVREALKKLEATGAVDIRHGSGVFVARSDDVLVLASRDQAAPTRKLLMDLLESRLSLELRAVALAAEHATQDHLREMRRLLELAGEHAQDDELLHALNLDFHHLIAVASGNVVLPQLVDALHQLFGRDQRRLLEIYGSGSRDQEEHLALLAALEARDADGAVALMRAHLGGVLDAVTRWEPEAESLT